MVEDQPAAKPEAGVDVVDDRAAGLGEHVVRPPVRRPARLVGVVLEELDPQVAGRLAEHLPHRTRLALAEAGEDRVGERRVRRVRRRHHLAVAGVERPVETLDQLEVSDRAHSPLWSDGAGSIRPSWPRIVAASK